MPIEFYCPGCGNLMQTPDETAGRKGRCPTCQLKVQIPGSSVATGSSDSSIRREISPPSVKAPSPIRFDCGSCGKTLSIAAANAGKKGQCPQCGELMSIPLKSQDSAAESRWKGTPTSPPGKPQQTRTKASGEKIEFHCSNCREIVRVGAAAAGKRGQCPRCKSVVQIPHKSTSVEGLRPIPSAPTKSPRPKQAASNQLTPNQPTPKQVTLGLTPLPSQPTEDTPASTPGLTPLPNAAGLTPIDEDVLSPLEPLGLTPLGPEELATEAARPGIAPFDNGNPFASPAISSAAPQPLRPQAGRRTSTAKDGTTSSTMVCGGCLVFYAAGQLVLVTLSLFVQGIGGLATMSQLRGQGEGAAAAGQMVGTVLGMSLAVGVMLTILAGGIQMIRLKAWGLCLAACILTMSPCNCFCLFGLPIGVWGIIMLSLAPVRSSFQ